MSESAPRLYKVYLRSGGAGDPPHEQTVRAAAVHAADGCLVFVGEDGSVSAFFDNDVVLTWHAIPEKQSLD